jgi:hypothetical protein
MLFNRIADAIAQADQVLLGGALVDFLPFLQNPFADLFS